MDAYYRVCSDNVSEFFRQLNKSAEAGDAVISSGREGAEWWAIIKAAGKTEATELLEAAQKIKRMCNREACDTCPLANDDGFCGVYGRPDMWDV